ncbi:MAG: ABC transporter substrate-binding protein [Candidatus Dormibacteraeota bacterium]|nr:ABC transporter substrate-binding protein [Candidatus Dormibacteraeota bacterium]
MGRLTRILAAMAIMVIGVAACGNSTSTSSGKIGGTVHILGTWTGTEKDSFDAVMKPFTDQTGVKISFEATRDLDAILQTKISAGNPPDVTAAPGVGTLIKLARAGKLIALDDKLDMSQLNSNYGSDWINLGKVDGKLITLYAWAALKGVVWYDPKAFQAKGYTAPKTWSDLTTLTAKIKADGGTPWCVALESQAASGWPGSDWHKEIVLSQAGPTVYDSWWQGKTKWSSPEIKQAWQTWGQQILGSNDSNVYGGKQYMIATTFGDGGQGLFASPPKCYMFNQGSFITSFFDGYTPKPTAGTDYAVFPLPDVSSANTGSHVVAGDAFVMTKDTPQARALLKYLATAEAQDIWVKRGGGKIAINKQVSLSDYPDAISKSLAQVVVDTKIARYDAGDLMPSDMRNAYWSAVLKFVQNQGQLDTILAELDKVQQTAYVGTSP